MGAKALPGSRPRRSRTTLLIWLQVYGGKICSSGRHPCSRTARCERGMHPCRCPCTAREVGCVMGGGGGSRAAKWYARVQGLGLSVFPGFEPQLSESRT